MAKQSLSDWQERHKSIAYWWSVGFGSGLMRPAPGTWGSLAGLAIGYALIQTSGLLGLIGAIIVVTGLSVHAINTIEGMTGIHDAPEIVIDEFAGQWVAMLPLTLFPFGWQELALSFVFFRVFDIVKPWPIGPLDKRVSGGFGVMVDDLVAGLFAAILVFGSMKLLV